MLTMTAEEVQSRKMKNKGIRSRLSGGSSQTKPSDSFFTAHTDTARSFNSAVHLFAGEDSYTSALFTHLYTDSSMFLTVRAPSHLHSCPAAGSG